MPFEPNPNDELIIDGTSYRVAEHPAAPGMAYGQEGRAGTVYRLLPSPQPPAVGAAGGRGEGQALKVFKSRFRLPYLVSQAERLGAFAALPGLSVCRRAVLTPQRHAALLRQHPDLTYAVLMPWIEGPTWQEVLLDGKPLSPQQSLALARGLAEALSQMEQQGIAHCDLSAPNVLLPALARSPGSAGDGGGGRASVELIDLEGLYAPGMARPQELSSGSAGYAHRQAAGGLWGPEADRFAGAVLLAEMLGYCDLQAVQAAWGESYFEPGEMQQEGARYRALVDSLRRTWGEGVAALFERAWHSDTQADCPTFGEWLVALPEKPPVGQAFSLSTSEGQAESLSYNEQAELSPAELTRAQVQALMQAARQLEEAGNLDGALVTYRQAQALAQSELALAALAREVGLVVQDLEGRGQRAAQAIPAAVAAPTPLPLSEPRRAEETVAEERPRRRWRGWVWALVGVVVVALIGGVFWQQQVQQQQARATATAQARATATAQARATATAQAIQTTVSALENQKRLVFGPSSGSLEHNAEDDLVSWDGAGVDLKNFVCEVTFFNPYSTNEGQWNYGIFFRDTGGDKQYRLSVTSEGKWYLGLVEDPTWEPIAEGYIDNLNTSPNGRNHLLLVVKEDIGFFFVNDIYISTLDVSRKQVSGDVIVATGIWGDDEITGKATRYEDFTVWSLP